jgi:cell division protein FtsB
MKIPEFLKVRAAIPAVLLLAVLVAAIAALVVFMLRISQLNDEIAGLHTIIAAEKGTSGDVLSEIEAARSEIESLTGENNNLKADNSTLRAEYDTLSAENETLKADIEKLRPYQLTFYAPNEYDLVVDQRLEPELVNMIKKHFSAVASGNLEVYNSTLKNKNDNYLLTFFESRKNTDISVTAIAAPDSMGAGSIESGPLFLTVTHIKEGVLNVDYIGVTKINKKWVVYDYD